MKTADEISHLRSEYAFKGPLVGRHHMNFYSTLPKRGGNL
jgi:hypothetical protein